MNINHSAASESGHDRLRSLPSFFIIGPPRTGTTWLHEVLSRRAVLPSPTKETRFFDAHFHRGIDWYLAHFTPTEGNQVGEVAPTYFASYHARERIARLIPEARVLCTFRDPLDRVLSLYRMKRAYGMIPWGFAEALRKDPELIESGKYATHLKEWLRVLGRDQVMPMFYEDLKGDPQVYVDKIAHFISLPRFDISHEENCNLHGTEKMTHPRNYLLTRAASQTADWLKARQLDHVVTSFKKSPLVNLVLGGGTNFEGIPQESAERVYELFQSEIEELETMWLSCAVAAALATLLFYESSYKTALPFAFLAIIAGTAILFGRLAGALGTVIASLVFASVLFEPRPSLAVDDPVAKAHLAWMAAVGVVLSDLIGRRRVAAPPRRTPTPTTPTTHF